MRGGGEEITQLKTNAIPAAAEKTQCLLLGEACFTACSKGGGRREGIISE